VNLGRDMLSKVVLLLSFLALVNGAAYRKHLAGPPSEFSSYILPSPAESALEQRSAQYEVFMSRTANGAVWTQILPVDSDTFFSFQLFSTMANKIQVSLKNPQGMIVNLATHKHQSELTSFPIGMGSVPGTNYFFEAPFPKGEWQITLSSLESLPLRADSEPDAILFFFNESPIKAHSYLSTYNLYLGEKIGLVTRLTEAADGSFKPMALKDTITKAVMGVHMPDGAEEQVEMHDDGLHSDEEPNDGVFGGYIPAMAIGMYRAEAFIEGVSSDGTKIVRSTQHLLPIVAEQISLVGTASVVPKDSQRVNILIDVSYLVRGPQKTFRAYTEVWGKDSNGKDIAVCWLAGMVDISQIDGGDAVILELNVNWLKKAGAQAPLTLKNVVIQDSDVSIPIAQAAEIPVTEMYQGVLPKVSAPMPIKITKEMTQGVFPKELLIQNANKSAAAPTLLLLHGYCSSVNPWKKYQEDFTNADYFLEPSSSLTNEEFAQLTIKHTEKAGMTSWSGIGHSQGGQVLAHLLNYYFTGLDQATGGRNIQAVGTPFLGCTGAGTAANLIALFGYGCGENFDLTTDGSKLWLAGITKETRKEVFYYSTTYKQGTWFGDYCNLAVNLLLKWPNDGTTEFIYTKLDGGNDQGNKQEWCHVEDMKYPAQYYDRQRNPQMNSLAAR
jgi:hypothetical protein